jgi:hypothetical protein
MAGAEDWPTRSSSVSRSCHAARSGRASSTARVRSFCAAVHARTSAESPSSNHRKGSGTSTPCTTSTVWSTRVWIGRIAAA